MRPDFYIPGATPRPRPIAESTAPTGGHAHRYRLEEPNGNPLVNGTCQNCGAERQFRSGFEFDDPLRRSAAW